MQNINRSDIHNYKDISVRGLDVNFNYNRYVLLESFAPVLDLGAKIQDILPFMLPLKWIKQNIFVLFVLSLYIWYSHFYFVQPHCNFLQLHCIYNKQAYNNPLRPVVTLKVVKAQMYMLVVCICTCSSLCTYLFTLVK